jgi:hypothetical protein
MTPDRIESGGLSQCRDGSSSLRRRLDSRGWSHPCGVAYASLAINGAGGSGPQMVLDLGRLGRVWRETAEEDANHDALRDLLNDQYSRPTRSGEGNGASL